jgi:CheY-like chemotaxis protein
MCRVLVAEDDPEMRRLVVEALVRDGHSVLEAIDGLDLAAKLSALVLDEPNEPWIDVVVSDVRMPGRGALDLLEDMAGRPPPVPFILMTAFGDEQTRRRAESFGAVLFDKPLSFLALRRAVKLLAGTE